MESLWDPPEGSDGQSAERVVVAGNIIKAAVLLSDPLARTSAPLWKRSERLATRLIRQLATYQNQRLEEALYDLKTAPRDVGLQRRLAGTIMEVLPGDDGRFMALVEASKVFNQRNRLDMWMGSAYRSGDTVAKWSPHQVSHLARPVSRSGSRDVCAVIDFRAAAGEPGRLRNLTASLLALNDQSLARDRYRIVCVEADGEPRNQSHISDLCDQYLHAPSWGPYNRSWAHNVGAVHGAGKKDRYLCFLDADVLLEHGYLEQVISDLDRQKLGAYLPHSSVLYLDDVSTEIALRQRFSAGGVPPDRSRFFGYRIPARGGSILVKTDVFHQIHGFDERYQGWGDEDNDFFYRVSAFTETRTGSGSLLHLNHGRPRMEVEGRRSNEWLLGREDWSETRIGDLGKYRDPQNDIEGHKNRSGETT
ncbi:hypothetical protein FH609_023970 [Streptomyces sp. 3MP-14]|uniref:Galactosyltransferase C-terminal domain-containing protein n=1 Tax=Streptomyces mimosae TaxID=2586635 RepID=A0A5N6AEE2_9ACTN|nr:MULTISPECIES: galactosyltransferase-related protein [Streptomyces]KAB8166413.1 hypothetical protein FH607_011330 [Streptomyces mimosae]KAB8174206.1 hypothetical protein FH609_023970 [Streptomyces sp. 3MP-14]